MSYSELMFVQADGEVVSGLELRNSHGGVTAVWGALVQKYKSLIYPKESSFMPAIRDPFSEWDDLWKAAEKDGLPLRWWEWNMLQWSYDNAIVKREHFAILAESMRRFEDALILPTRVCHFSRIADAIESARADYVATCFHATSVNENPWWVRSENEDEEGDPYNINTGTKHWFVECRGPDWKKPELDEVAARVERERARLVAQ